MQKKRPSGNQKVQASLRKGNIRKLAVKKNILSNGVVTVKDEPLVKSTKLSMPSPIFGYNKNGDMKLTHCELINTITTTNDNNSVNGFTLVGWAVNAGLKSTFPFLSSLAANYKTYKFSSLSFHFIARGNYTRDGAVMFYAEYDPDTQPPENRIEFLNRSNAVENQVFKNTTYALKKKDMEKEKSHYVRLGKVDNIKDLKLYDVANLFFAYEGTPKNTLIGDIFVSYSVTLETPTVRLAEKQIKNMETYKGQNTGGADCTNANPFGGVGLTIGSFLGDVAGSLLSTVTGGLSGQFFSIGKSVCKLIQAFIPTSTAGGYCDKPVLSVGIPKINKLGSLRNGDSLFIDEDYTDVITTLANSASELAYSNSITDITSTNLIDLLDDGNGATFTRTRTWAVVLPAGAILRYIMPTGGVLNPAAGTYPSIKFIDYDPRKTGELNPNNVQFMDF